MAFFLSWRRRTHVSDPESPAASDWPAAATALAASAPVHVLRGDAPIGVDAGRLLIHVDGADLRLLPINAVASLHIHGWAQASAAAITQLVAQGSPVLWRSPGGYPLAIAAPLSASGLEGRRGQFRAAAVPATRLGYARSFVAAKIRNQRGLLRRRLGAEAKQTLLKLERVARKAEHAGSLSSLLGAEGEAAAAYFSIFPRLLADGVSETAFSGRTRRPPADLGNAAMSYLYAVLAGECVCALAAAGLDPREGLLHEARGSRPALALDFMEPLRPLVGDAAATALINRRQLKHNQDNPGQLGDDGRKLVLAEYEKRMAAPAWFLVEPAGVSLREAIHRSARLLAKCLAAGADFSPICQR